jgi:hypothetical protein
MGFKYDTELSNNDRKVIVDKDGTPNIVYRGTKQSRVKDWISDIALGLGLQRFDPRFRDAKRIANNVEAKYNTAANVVGHSLGGSLAENSGAHGNIITFNKGAGLGDIGKTIPKRQTDIRVANDIVSKIGTTQNNKYNNFKELDANHHGFISAHNLENLKDIKYE